jgi:hypothetical protein
MCNRRELEGLIVIGVEELTRLERLLTRQWDALATAPRDARVSFLSDLVQFQEKANRLERLVDALNEPDRTLPAAA